MALTYSPPPQNEVFAADLKTGFSQREIKINFTETSTGTVGITMKNSVSNDLINFSLTKSGNNYAGSMALPIGSYEYFFTDSLIPNANPTKYRFSVGYVFVVVSHSFGEANGEQHCTDNRVFIYNDYQARIDADWKNLAKYTGGSYRNPSAIYAAAVAANDPNIYDKHQVGPWSRLGQLLAVRDNMTVAIINCAMGGSSVEMYADEAAGRPFKHGFAVSVQGVPDYNLYNSGFPYFHFENVMKTIAKRNGITAILVQHGENDMQKNPVTLGFLYKTFLDAARNRAEMYGVPVVLSKSSWLLNSQPWVTNQVINENLASIDEALKVTEYSYLGPDLHLIPQSMRGQPNKPTDGHWNPDGAKEAARLWAEHLTKSFLIKIGSGESTLPKSLPIISTQNSTNTMTQNLANNASPKSNRISDVIIGILIVIGVFVVFSLLKFFKIFTKFANKTIVAIAVGIGVVFYAISLLFKTKK